MMERTADATMEREGSQHASTAVDARAGRRAQVEESLATRVAGLTLLLGPAVAVAAAATLTMGDESLRAPAIFAFLLSIGCIAAAHRAWEARGVASRTQR